MAGTAMVRLEEAVAPTDTATVELEEVAAPADTATVGLEEVVAPCWRFVDGVPVPQQS